MNNYPIILAHGIARFDFLIQQFAKDLGVFGLNFDLANDGLNYFKGIARHLRNNGFDVYQSSVSFAANVERRAADLTTEACRAFNEAAEASEAANAVFYQKYSSAEEKAKIFTPLQPAWEIIQAVEGANNGLVPVSSQQWESELTDGKGWRKPIRQHEFPIPADHLNEIGWWDLHQLKISDLFRDILPTIIKNYENGITDVYLKIARDVQLLA